MRKVEGMRRERREQRKTMLLVNIIRSDQHLNMFHQGLFQEGLVCDL